MNKILYLSIAGFVIKLVFHKSTDKQNKVTPARFIKEILIHNEGFILTEEPASTDVIIEFLEAKGFDIYESPKKKGFIHFYTPVAYQHISTFYHISRIQFIYLLKSAIEALLVKRGLVMHCSANMMDDQAVLYIGKSGIGKTTLISMLQNEYPVLADDEGYIKKEGNSFYFYQGPFLERSYNFKKTSKQFRIAAIFILEQGDTCKISKSKKKDELFISSHLLSKQEPSVYDLKLISGIKKSVPFKKLVFTKNKNELMNCILNHSPFDNSSRLNTE